ncbi:MAG: hypothetical protein NTZ42_02585 [Candidatus Gribaldobacteria bacterium]|nr:hypothetical protein [Candidatus Gribaldobacteria bacterium]
METLTWQIKKEDFGFLKRLCGDVEYSIGDDGIKITEKGQAKLYPWNELKFFWPNNLNLRHGYFGGLGFKNLMRDVNIIQNLPNEKIGELFTVYPKGNYFFTFSRAYLFICAAGYNAKDVLEALKNRLPIWNNFLYAIIIGHTFGYLVFILGFSIPIYYAIYEKWTPIFGLLSGVVVLFLLYGCIQNIRYFFKFRKQQWQRD